MEELEQTLARQLGVKHVLYISNSMLALQLAIQVFNLRGEVLTTLFSYMASSSLL